MRPVYLINIPLALAVACSVPEDAPGPEGDRRSLSQSDTDGSTQGWTVIASGEVEHTFVDCADCCDEMIVRVVSSATEFQTVAADELPGVVVPTVDFSTKQVAIAYIVQCPDLGRELRIDDVTSSGDVLTVAATLRVVQEDLLSVLTRPYSIVEVPDGEYVSGASTLTVE